jgi:RHS repeat-associated protein
MMKAIKSNLPDTAWKRLEFAYDYQGRRIQKRVFTQLEGGTAVLDLKYFYDGWNLLAEVNTANQVVRSYVWGLDLSGSVQGAGGVGGLLMVKEGSGQGHFVGYDGNGNVVTMVNASSGVVSARYEYGPFGEAIRATGPMAKANPFRFSTKYTDDETDLVYYGFRYYNPSTGRWPSRDPIGERGGINIYSFLSNRSVNTFDILGWSDYNRPPSVAFPNSPARYGPPCPEPGNYPAVQRPATRVSRAARKIVDEQFCCDTVWLRATMWTVFDILDCGATVFDDPLSLAFGPLDTVRDLGEGIGGGSTDGYCRDLGRACSLILILTPIKKCCQIGSYKNYSAPANFYYYEISQKTLTDFKYNGMPKCNTITEIIERGKQMVEQAPIQAAKPEGTGWMLGFPNTILTAPTPAGSFCCGVAGSQAVCIKERP